MSGSPQGCWCETCRDERLAGLPLVQQLQEGLAMILCPLCGNKRCPRATYHGNTCTSSNAPGQPGSSYA
jgi:Zn finger protein HypA/HybF involved in hydrogenase expression